jgi:hypothetical protein
MPHIDGGTHATPYPRNDTAFLIALLPMRAGLTAPQREALCEGLAALPAALTSLAAGQAGPFARFALTGEAARPCLLLTIAFGAASSTVPAAYLRGLWTAMEPELRAVLRHCEGSVEDPDGFVRLVQACQLGTATPPAWHDGAGRPRLPPLRRSLAPMLLASAALVTGLLGALIAAASGFDVRGWLLLSLFGFTALPVAGLLAWRSAAAWGLAPPSEPANMNEEPHLQLRFSTHPQGAAVLPAPLPALPIHFTHNRGREEAVLRPAPPAGQSRLSRP